MLESTFRRKLVGKIEKRFPGCVVLKNDPADNQGIPDLLILFRHVWAMLECKKAEDAPYRPNQEYYVSFYDGLSFCEFIYPENEERILNELDRYFSGCGLAF